MTRCAHLALFLAGAALLAGLAVAACAGRGEPDAAYLEGLSTWTASQLLHEHKALRAEEEALAARLAEARTSELPPTAREAAQRSLEDSLQTVQGKRRAVDQALAAGRYARSEKRYPVQQLVLRAEPPAGVQTPPDQPGPAGAQSAPPAPTPRTAGKKGSPPPVPASPPEPPAPAAAPTPAPAKVQPAPAEFQAATEKSPAPAGSARVLGVETARTAEGLEIRIHMEGKAARRLFTMGGPPRIVLDILGVAEPAFRLFNRTLAAVEARSLRLGWHNDAAMLRLVLDTDPAHLDRAVLEETADGLVLRVAP